MLRGWDEGYAIPSLGILVGHKHTAKGIGGMLMRYVIASAVELGASSIRLSVNESNHLAFHLYTSCGFKEITREIINAGDEKDAKLIMMLDLKV
jgi:ribosomal protein S18 acetylase RimI-like enzyme